MKQKTIVDNKILFTVWLFLEAVFLISVTSAQNANVRINKFWGSVSAAGQNTAVTYSGADLNTFADQGAVGARLNGGESYFTGYTTVACTNWRDSVNNTIIPYAVFPPVNARQPNGRIITALTSYARYTSPVDSVYYQANRNRLPSPNYGTLTGVNPSMCIGTSDQTVSVTNQYVCGVQVTRKVLAWSQQFHENYIITDFTFNNVSQDTLHGFYIYFNEGNYYISLADGNTPGVAAVDQWQNGNAARKWSHYYGALTTDTLRILYQYAADDPDKIGDNMGQPLTEQQGRLLDKNFWFMATLHASQHPYTSTASYSGPIDPSDADDSNQPSVTTVANLANVLSLPLMTNAFDINSPGYYSIISGQTLASEDMTGANVRPGHHRRNLDELGKNAPGGEPGISTYANSFESLICCYGPYEFYPGQQIRVVKASGVAGISREVAVDVGRRWLADKRDGTNILQDPPNLPNAVTGYFPSNFVYPSDATEIDKKKDRWVSLGIKEMLETVDRAKWNLRTNYSVPVTPPPPPLVVVRPVVGGVNISWSPSAAESMPGFKGYRVLKKVSTYDTVYYRTVFQDTGHSFYDTHVRVSARTFYYVQAGVDIAVNDMNAHPTERGQTIWSSRFWTYNTATAGTASETYPNMENKLERIAIVPNPFNYKDFNLPGYNIQTPRNLAITFYELPADVTIKIFTEYGDLVKTIEHHRFSGNETWKMVNERGQAIASGIYVVVFQTPDGAFSYQKLVVAR